MGCCTCSANSMTSEQLTAELLNQTQNVKTESQMYTSKDELLVYGWLREKTKDNFPADLMNICLHFYINNEWIRPNIECTKNEELLTEEHIEHITSALLYSYEKGQPLYELIEATRDRLFEQSKITSFMARHSGAVWIYKDGLQNFTHSNWKVDAIEISIWCTKPPPLVDEQIICQDQGSMDKEHHDVIRNVLKYCIRNDEMRCVSIMERLQERGMKAIVIKDHHDASWYDLGEMKHSSWRSSKYGFYTIIIQRFRPTNCTEITCNHAGNMTNEDGNVVEETLRYCLENDKMTCIK